MTRHRSALLALLAIASSSVGCRAVRARFHRSPTQRARAISAARTDASAPAAAHPSLPPDTITVRLGTPGDGGPLPLDLPIEPAPLRIVVDSPYQAWSDEGTFVHVVATTPDLHPCERAEVYAGNHQIGRTDSNGDFAFRRTPRPHSADDHDTHDGDPRERVLTVICHRDAQSYVATAQYGAMDRTSSFERPVVYVYTDRGVYNPGQTLHARAIAWRLRGDYVPVANQTVTLSLRREDGTPLGGGPLTTDDFGTGALDVALPAHLPEGRYALVATAGTETAEAHVRVQRFVPPVIEVQHTLGEFLTPAMHVLPFEVRLHYFDGAPFVAGRVAITATIDGADVPIVTRAVQGSGPHRFVLPETVLARARAVLRDGERMDVNLVVSDDHARSDTVHRTLRFARNPYTATIELDRTEYAPGERVDATVRIVDLEHVVVRSKPVTLRGLAQSLTGNTDSDGVVHFRFAMPRSHARLEALVDDVDGAIADASLQPSEVHPMQSTIAQTTLREREPVDVTVRFPANYVPVEDVVHADVVDSSGAIIDSFAIAIDRSGRVPIGHARFIAPSWGSMLLTLYASAAPPDRMRDPSAVGLVTDGQNVAVVPGASLDVTLEPLPAEVAPGSRMTVRAHVMRDGHPVDARIGASVVDQAVISLLDPLEHAPRDRFYNPEQKVLASTGAQTLTWPVVQRNWGADRYDIGWPYSFGFHSAGNGRDERWIAVDGSSGALTLRRAGVDRRRMVAQGGIFAALGAPGGGSAGAVSPFGSMTGDSLGDAFGYGGLGATGTGWGGGGTGEGTIGLGNIGTMGHGAGRGAQAQEPPRLVVRTNFAETAAWLPALDTREGVVTFDVDMPDSVTRQQISLIATDRHGGIGVHRVEIPVRQPFYVRSDLPPTLVEGDRTQVAMAARNLGDAPVHASLGLHSDDITVRATSPLDVDVAAHGTETASFEVTAGRAGRASYHFDATSPTIIDRGQRTLYVQPAGVPARSREEGDVHAGSDYALTFDDASDRYAVHTLSIAFPTVADLTAVLAAADTVLGSDVESIATELDVATSLLTAAGIPAGSQNGREVRARAARALIALIASSNVDGGYGWWPQRRSNATLTAFVLEVLARADHAGLPVPPTALSTTAQFVARQVLRHTLVDAHAIAAWEGNSERVASVLQAEAASALSSLPRAMRQDEVADALAALRPTLQSIVTRSSSSPLELAHAARALAAIDDTLPSVTIDRLLSARHERHWEPGWFDAFGGGIEATGVALDALERVHRLDDDARTHDAVEYLLATRGEWGRWHNLRGTAWAIRALTRLPLGHESAGAHVHVELDGRVIADTTIDAADPWASTLALRHIELQDLPRGAHRISVHYDGALTARVVVDHQRWRANAPAVDANGPTLEVTFPPSARNDASIPLDVRLAHLVPGRVARVSIPLPAYADPDAASLRALVASGALEGFHVGARAVECVIASPQREASFRFTFHLPRVGHYTVTGARAQVDGGIAFEARATSIDVL